MYLLKKELKLSYSAIGRKLGNKDHTTVMHSYALIEKEYEQNQNFSQEVEMILQRIYSNN
jgi:chromosomal replication initiator protein